MTTDLDLLIRLTKENERLQKQVTELQTRGTELVLELRNVDRKKMVREFFTIADQTIGERPNVPDANTVRFRLKLVAEEFFELLVAAFGLEKDGVNQGAKDVSVNAYESTMMLIDRYQLNVDLPELADAVIDTSYVLEGLLIAFGINSTPLWSEVHAANLRKRGGPKREDGKLVKKPDFIPPRIEELLREQGFK